MKLKIRENQTGTMILNDGTEVNYGTIRVTQNMSTLIYYTGKDLREIFKPDATELKNGRQKNYYTNSLS